MNIYEQIDRNRAQTRLLIAVFILFFAGIGLGMDFYYGAGIKAPIFTFIALVFSIVSSYSGFRYGDRLVLSSSNARPLDLSDPKQKQWQNVVDEMSIAGGMPAPKTYIVDDPDPNAFATGRSLETASIAVTKGLLEKLNREELQGVAAHEMSHIRNFDIRLMLIIAVLVGSIALISDWAGRSMFWGSRRRSRGSKSSGGTGILFVIWLIAVVLAPILAQMMAMLVSRKREYLADASGAQLTRNPMGLASALEKISSSAEPTTSINKGSAHLCIADPRGSALGMKEGWAADLLATHPPIFRRIESLKQMSYLAVEK